MGDHGCEYMTGGRVVVLGPTGRNFAAGMSGGIAYALHLSPQRVNTEMVDIEPLSAADADWLHGVVRRHTEETGSAIGAALLGGWRRRVREFSKLMPRDYRRVLEATKMAQATGRSADDVVMEASHG